MKLFGLITKSRKSGLLSDTFSLWIIVLLVAGLVGLAGFSVFRISFYDSALPLRYATLSGLYDSGQWYRPYLLLGFAAGVLAVNIAIATYLNVQKSILIARSVLVVTALEFAISIMILAHVVTGTTI